MRERKYVKFRVDMYEDTKFKIIDMKPERDVIHYIWSRLVLLAGKVNLEGELFLSKNIAYTIETLAIEFNRDASQIKLALEVFIELEMIELTEDRVYRVKNFVKHQNIKVKKEEIGNIQNNEANNYAVQANKDFNDQLIRSDHEDFDGQTKKSDEKDKDYKIAENDHRVTYSNGENTVGINEEIIQPSNKSIITVDDGEAGKKSRDNLLEYRAKTLQSKKRATSGRKKKNNTSNNYDIGEIVEEDGDLADTSSFTEGVKPLEKGEKSILEISFV